MYKPASDHKQFPIRQRGGKEQGPSGTEAIIRMLDELKYLDRSAALERDGAVKSK
jgi:hypothetical protein